MITSAPLQRNLNARRMRRMCGSCVSLQVKYVMSCSADLIEQMLWNKAKSNCKDEGFVLNLPRMSIFYSLWVSMQYSCTPQRIPLCKNNIQNYVNCPACINSQLNQGRTNTSEIITSDIDHLFLRHLTCNFKPVASSSVARPPSKTSGPPLTDLRWNAMVTGRLNKQLVGI